MVFVRDSEVAIDTFSSINADDLTGDKARSREARIDYRFEEWRPDRTRRDAVGSDIINRPLAGHVPRHLVHR